MDMHNECAMLTVSSLQKVFPNETPTLVQSAYTVMQNEVFHFQVCCKATNLTQMLRVDIDSDVADRISVRVVEGIPARYAKNVNIDDYYIKGHGNNDVYPDLLRPNIQNNEIFVPDNWFTYWITIDGRDSLLPVGKHDIKIRVYNTYAEGMWFYYDSTCVYTLNVIEGVLPKTGITYTRWLHYDCICDKHGVEPFTDGFYKITAEYVKSAVKHGMNMLYVPIITPSLDTQIGSYRRTVQLVKVFLNGGKYSFDFTELKRFLDFALSLGIEKFELAHLASQWGAKYTPKVVATVDGEEKRIFGWEYPITYPEYSRFLNAMLPELKKFFEDNGYIDRVYFHISDEPQPDALDNFRVVWDIVSKVFPNARFMDALSHSDFYDAGYINHPVVGIEVYDNFPTEWVYYCGCMCRKYETNCHFIMPSQRTRILGFEMYRNGSTGFLQWAINYYHTTNSRQKIDPYFVSDAGGGFEAGDSYVVYPAGDTVYESLRHEVFFDAFQDYSALKVLESYIGKDKVLQLLDDEGVKKNYKDYPRSAEWHLAFKLKIYDLIEQARKAAKA